MAMHRVLAATAALLAAAALTACNDATAKGPKASSPPSAAAPTRLTLPKPVGKTVLTVLPGGGKAPVQIDFAALDQVATRTYSIFEPFDKKQTTFHGVELADVLEAAGVAADATAIRMIAIDDYLIDLEMSIVRAGGVILATRADNAEIPVAKGGPIRVVFGDDVEEGKNTDRWIWSLSSVEVTK